MTQGGISTHSDLTGVLYHVLGQRGRFVHYDQAPRVAAPRVAAKLLWRLEHLVPYDLAPGVVVNLMLPG